MSDMFPEPGIAGMTTEQKKLHREALARELDIVTAREKYDGQDEDAAAIKEQIVLHGGKK